MYKTSCTKCTACKFRFNCLLDRFPLFENIKVFFLMKSNSIRIQQAHSGTYIQIKSVSSIIITYLLDYFDNVNDIRRRVESLNVFTEAVMYRCYYIGRDRINAVHVSQVIRNPKNKECLDLILTYIKLISNLTNVEICDDATLIDVVEGFHGKKWYEYFAVKKHSDTTSGQSKNI